MAATTAAMTVNMTAVMAAETEYPNALAAEA
jgi:hypothetical protein